MVLLISSLHLLAEDIYFSVNLADGAKRTRKFGLGNGMRNIMSDIIEKPDPNKVRGEYEANPKANGKEIYHYYDKFSQEKS